MPESGVTSILKYDWMNGSSWKPFGQRARITALEKANNVEGLYTLGIRNWNYFVAKQYSNRITVEWVLSNPWIWKAILGTGTSSGSTPPYTHTFTPATSSSDFSRIKIQNYLYDLGVVSYTNGICASTTLSANAGEPVIMSGEFLTKNEELQAAGIQAATDTFNPYNFSQGVIKYYQGGSYYDIGYVRTFELTISNEAEALYALGSRLPSNILAKNLVITGTMSVILNSDSDLLRRFYESNTAGSPGDKKVSPFNDVYLYLTQSDDEYMELHLSKIVFDTYSLPQSPTDAIIEDLTFVADTITVTAKNGVSQIP